MWQRPTQKQKRQRAIQAYLDLVDTAEWLQARMRGQLEMFDITMAGFRLLELLYRQGPLTLPEAAKLRGCRRQNLDVIIARLEERGWVGREVVTYAPAKIRKSRLPRALRGKRRVGRRVAMVSLTKRGKKFIGTVFPRHARVARAFIRALHSREVESLSRICEKLREGHVMRFVNEITKPFQDDEGLVEGEEPFEGYEAEGADEVQEDDEGNEEAPEAQSSESKATAADTRQIAPIRPRNDP